MKWFALIIPFIIVVSVTAQQTNTQDSSWYKIKYKVSSLEDLGIEKLEIERAQYKRDRNIGIVCTVGGLTLTMAGISASLQDFNWGEEEKGFKKEDFIILAGVGIFVGGAITWITKGARHNQIMKAIELVDVKVESMNYYNGKQNNLCQLGITINF